MKRNAMIAVGVVGTLATAIARAPGQVGIVETDPMERVYYDEADEQGRLSGGVILLPRPDIQTLMPGPNAVWTTIVDHGTSSNRRDIVFVGGPTLRRSLNAFMPGI